MLLFNPSTYIVRRADPAHTRHGMAGAGRTATQRNEVRHDGKQVTLPQAAYQQACAQRHDVLAGHVKGASLRRRLQLEKSGRPSLPALLALCHRATPDSYLLGIREPDGLGRMRIRLYFDDTPDTCPDTRTEADRLGMEGLRAVLVNALHEYSTPEPDKHNGIRNILRSIDKNPDQKIRISILRRYLDPLAEELRRVQRLLHPALNAPSTAPREAPRMPSECLVHWIVALDDERAALEQQENYDAAGKIAELQSVAETCWLDQDLRIDYMRTFLLGAREDCIRLGREGLAACAATLSGQLPAPGKEGIEHNMTRLLDNPYMRAFDVLLVDSVIRTPNQEMLASVNALGHWLCKQLVPDIGEPTSDCLARVKCLQEAVQALTWNWIHAIPELKQFARSEDTGTALSLMTTYLGRPKSHGLDLIAIPYLVWRNFVPLPNSQRPAWLLASDGHYWAVIKPWRVRVDTIRDASTEYRKAAEQDYQAQKITDEEWDERDAHATAVENVTDAGMPRQRVAGATLLHQPPAVELPWRSNAPRSAIHYKPDFSVFAKDGKDAAEARRHSRFAQLLRNGRYVGDYSGVTNILLHAAAQARSEGFQVDPDAIWKAVAFEVVYDGGHQLEECHSVAVGLNASLKLGIGGKLFEPEGSGFGYESLISGQDEEYWFDRFEDAFHELREYFRRTSFFYKAPDTA